MSGLYMNMSMATACRLQSDRPIDLLLAYFGSALHAENWRIIRPKTKDMYCKPRFLNISDCYEVIAFPTGS